MKTISKKISIPLCLVIVGMSALNACAIELDPAAKADAQPEAGHGTKIVQHIEARTAKLGELLTQHTKRVADKTEEATTRVVAHIERDGRKVGDVMKRTADKIEAKIDRLTD